MGNKSDFLNDYLELNYIELILEETISQVIFDFPSTELFFQLLKKDRTFKKQLNLKHYVLSLSENPDSLALWSNYSNHDGYNIGFKVTDLIMTEAHKGTGSDFLGLEYIIQHGKVVYDRSRQKELLYKELSEAARSWKNHSNISSPKQYDFGNDYEVRNTQTRIDIYALYFKHPSFYHEEEYRFVFSPAWRNREDNLVKFRVSNGVIVPYIEIPLSKEYRVQSQGKLPLNSIMIGPKNNLDIAILGIETFLNKNGYVEPISVTKSQIPLRF